MARIAFPVSLDVLKLVVGVYPCPCLLMRLLSGSRTRQNKRGERLSPWKIPRPIFTCSISIFPSECCNVNVEFSSPIAFSINLIIWGLIVYLHAFYHPQMWDTVESFLIIYPGGGEFGSSHFAIFKYSLVQ